MSVQEMGVKALRIIASTQQAAQPTMRTSYGATLYQKLPPDFLIKIFSYLDSRDLCKLNTGGGKCFQKGDFAYRTLNPQLPTRTIINVETNFSWLELKGCQSILRLTDMAYVFQRMTGVKRILASKADTARILSLAQGRYPLCSSLNISPHTTRPAVRKLLAACPNLEELKAWQMEDEAGSFNGLANCCHNLTSLDLSSSDFPPEELKEFLKLNPKIKRLSIRSKHDYTSVLCPHMHKFEWLTIEATCDINTLIGRATSLCRLRIIEVGVWRTKVSEETLQLIAKFLPRLEELSVPGRLIKAMIATLPQYTGLLHLDVSDGDLNDSDVAAIASRAPHLEGLILNGSRNLTDASIMTLIAPVILSTVYGDFSFRESKDEDFQIDFYPTRPTPNLRLRTLGLRSCCKITSAALCALVKCHPQLANLDISRMPETTLLGTLPHLKQLSTLHIGPAEKEFAGASHCKVMDALSRSCGNTLKHLTFHSSFYERTPDIDLQIYYFGHVAAFMQKMVALETFALYRYTGYIAPLSEINTTISSLAEFRSHVQCLIAEVYP